MGCQLEKFDPHTRAVVKHKFATILFEAELGTYMQRAVLPAPMHPNPSPQWSNPGSTHSSMVSTPLQSPNDQQAEQIYQENQTYDREAINTDSTPDQFPAPGAGPVLVAYSMTQPSTSTKDLSSGFSMPYTRLY